MTTISGATHSGALRRQFMEGRSAERLADEIRHQELAHIRATRKELRGGRRAPGPEDQAGHQNQ